MSNRKSRNPKRFKQYRKDGWPLCPRCGEDELFSHEMIVWSDPGFKPSLDDCLKETFSCYNCAWTEEK